MYKILNQTAQSTEILLYSLIHEGITARRIIAELQQHPSERITLRINSDGGEVFEAIAIYNYLKDKTVDVIIDGICASAASIVAMCGKKITARRGSMMMIHNPITYGAGDAEELRQQADVLDKVTENIAAIYSAKTGKTASEIKQLMNSETWMNAEEAKAAGLVDVIEQAPETNPEPKPKTTASYEDGIIAERQRLKLLDELYTPSRAKILNRAKYETGETAEQIALELLKSEPSQMARTDTLDVSSLRAGTAEDAEIAAMVKAMNAMRR